MRRLLALAVAAGAVLTAAPAHAQRTSVVTATDPAGDANGYVYVDPDDDVDGPTNPVTSDPHYDLVRLTAVATPDGVRLTARLAAPVADAGETVWIGLTPVESDCTLLVRVSDTIINGQPYTGLASWCGSGVTVNSVWRHDKADTRADQPSAFVPYSAFPGTIARNGAVKLRAETMRDAGGATVHVVRVPLDGMMAQPRLRLLGTR